MDLNVPLFLPPPPWFGPGLRGRGGVLLCLSVKLWDGYYYCCCYYDYNDELSCCCCYTKAGPSAIDLKPQQSRALASRSARENLTDRPTNEAKTAGLIENTPAPPPRPAPPVSDRLVSFFVCFLGLDSCCVVWLSNCEFLQPFILYCRISSSGGMY